MAMGGTFLTAGRNLRRQDPETPKPAGAGGAQGEPGVSSRPTALDKSAAARDPGPVRPVATGFNGDRGHAMLGVKGRCG
jgi:hypothetical protein